jgi:hypothetical protein
LGWVGGGDGVDEAYGIKRVRRKVNGRTRGKGKGDLGNRGR